MLRSLQVAQAGMTAQQSRVEVIANNLANANTTGFKRILTAFEGVAAEPAPGGRPLAQNGLRAPVSGELRPLSGIDMRQGPLTMTSNPLDFAVEGDGFFAIRTPAGERLTRDGAFHRNEADQLVTAAGLPVLGSGGPIQIPPGVMEIASDGTITVEGNQVGQMKLVRVDDPKDLIHESGNLFSVRDGARALPVSPEESRVQPGFLEGSNANPVTDLIHMITAQRIFEAGQRVLSTADETLGRIINETGRTG